MSVIKHYGIKRRSGRYPWGSGGNAEQRATSFQGYVKEMRSKGMTDAQIAKGVGLSSTELRATISIAKTEKRAADRAQALRLYDKGVSKTEIGRRMGRNESSIRDLLNDSINERVQATQNTADVLKNAVAAKGMVDVGKGVNYGIGVTEARMRTALKILESDGYVVHNIYVKQLGTDKQTTVKVLAPPGTDTKDIFKNRFNIGTVTDYSEDRGRSSLGLKPVKSVSSDRVSIAYHEDGGSLKDGVIELRRGVSDLDLGNARYAQVRIGVDGTHYLKGMAMYADDLPPGVDIRFNTNKSNKKSKKEVLKEMKVDSETGKIDKDNPFGATIKREGQKGSLNVVNEEGDWETWSKSISSQMLSKQKATLAKKQLDLAYNIQKEELDEIMSLTNPTVRRKLLLEYADGADAASIHLKAAGLPRQASKVLLPFPDMKETEVYAPTFRDGEKVVLIRYPHGGTFEIPELTVNNKNKKAKSLIQNARDAIGINSKVAERLSGADFDGDTVLVIPNNQGEIRTSAPLKNLKDFDPQSYYPKYDGMETIDGGKYNASTGKVDYGGKKPDTRRKGTEMGYVSNLITDMTIKGANDDDLARAVRHSMVVIDAEKHVLNYKQSYIDNGIAELNKTYQGRSRGGASTVVSKASSRKDVDQRKEGARVTDPVTGKTLTVYIDPATGKKLYRNTGAEYTNKQGKVVKKTTKITKMESVDDAFELSSGTRIEEVYATYANGMKDLANAARKEYTTTPKLVYSPSAKKTYATEVSSLNAQLEIALSNKPLERQAQIIANATVAAKKAAKPLMDKDEIKKINGQALTEARLRVGADKTEIKISSKEWEAIQAGAISDNKLSQILNNTNDKQLKELSLPKATPLMSDLKILRAENMIRQGHTQAEVADALGVSTTSLTKALN